jgi:hypothetical protein
MRRHRLHVHHKYRHRLYHCRGETGREQRYGYGLDGYTFELPVRSNRKRGEIYRENQGIDLAAME